MMCAERAAQRVAIIDHGKIVMNDTPANIVAASGTANLEDAFIKLTGHEIREQEGTGMDQMRTMRQMWRGGRK